MRNRGRSSAACAPPPLEALLGILALAEVLGNKSPELRELLSPTDAQVKGLAAVVFCLALAPAADPALGTSLPVFQSGFAGPVSWTALWALVIGAGTWFLARLRKGIYLFLAEVDEDDDLGLQKLLSWVEDGIGFLGVLFVVVLPAVSLAVTGLTLLALYLVQKHLERREEKRKVPCGDCGTPNPLCSFFCSRCGKERSHVRQVGFLGTIKEAPTNRVALCVAGKFPKPAARRVARPLWQHSRGPSGRRQPGFLPPRASAFGLSPGLSSSGPLGRPPS